jgi:hypothetical protein
LTAAAAFFGAAFLAAGFLATFLVVFLETFLGATFLGATFLGATFFDANFATITNHIRNFVRICRTLTPGKLLITKNDSANFPD